MLSSGVLPLTAILVQDHNSLNSLFACRFPCAAACYCRVCRYTMIGTLLEPVLLDYSLIAHYAVYNLINTTPEQYWRLSELLP